MKKVVKWIVLVWCILAIPYVFDEESFSTIFFQMLFLGLIIGLLVSDLREESKKDKTSG